MDLLHKIKVVQVVASISVCLKGCLAGRLKSLALAAWLGCLGTAWMLEKFLTNKKYKEYNVAKGPALV